MPLEREIICQSHDTTMVQRELRRSDWFAALSDAHQYALVAMGRPRALVNGEFLFLRGDAADGLYCVLRTAWQCADWREQRLGKNQHLGPADHRPVAGGTGVVR